MYRSNLDPAAVLPALDDKYVRKARTAFTKSMTFDDVMASREDVVLQDQSETPELNSAPVREVPYLMAPRDEVNPRSLVIALSLIMMRDKEETLNQFSGYVSIIHMMARRIKDQAIECMILYGFRLVPIEVRTKDEILSLFSFTDTDLEADLTSRAGPVRIICGTTRADVKRILPIQHLGTVESAVIGFMLTLLCKQMTEESFIEWTKRRWDALIRTTGGQPQDSHIRTNDLPPLQTCTRIYCKVSNSYLYRCLIFRTLLKTVTKLSTWGSVAATVVTYFRGCELTHITLIQTYLLKQHPLLTCYRPLVPAFSKYFDALGRLSTMAHETECLCKNLVS